MTIIMDVEDPSFCLVKLFQECQHQDQREIEGMEEGDVEIKMGKTADEGCNLLCMVAIIDDRDWQCGAASIFRDV
ncbi:hypothetical protein SCA6_003877 [Theobroma cacao]